MDYSPYQKEHHLEVTVVDRVALVKMDRPEVSNTVDFPMHSGLERIFYDLSNDKDVGAVVLTGVGVDFCVGGEVANQGLAARQRGMAERLRGPRFLVQALVNCEVPVIAAVNGTAAQLGATIAMVCDIIYMADDAQIGDTHIKAGLVPGDGGAVVWPLMIGPHRAKEYLMTGRMIDAAKAEGMGLVNAVFPAGRLLEEAMALARELANGPGLAIRWTKMAVNHLILQNLNLVLEAGMATQAMSVWTEDHLEGVAAVREKREPKFKSS